MLHVSRSILSSEQTSSSSFLVTKRYKGRRLPYMVRKPKIIVKFNKQGNIKYPTKVKGWNSEDLSSFNIWLKKIVNEDVGREGVDKRGSLSFLQNRVNDELKVRYGLAKVNATRRRVKRKLLTAKKRAVNRRAKKMEKWQHNEDMKEDRIVRYYTRQDEINRGVQFSWKRFVTFQNELRRKPVEIGTEEEFTERIKDAMKVHYWHGPKSAWTAINGNEGYQTRRRYEIEDPALYEARRAAFVSTMIEEREYFIEKRHEELEIAKEYDRTRDKKLRDHEKRVEVWNDVYSKWTESNKVLKRMKKEYKEQRDLVFKKARIEFLKAISEDKDKWVESPDECRFLRFKFKEGVTFPWPGKKPVDPFDVNDEEFETYHKDEDWIDDAEGDEEEGEIYNAPEGVDDVDDFIQMGEANFEAPQYDRPSGLNLDDNTYDEIQDFKKWASEKGLDESVYGSVDGLSKEDFEELKELMEKDQYEEAGKPEKKTKVTRELPMGYEDIERLIPDLEQFGEALQGTNPDEIDLSNLDIRKIQQLASHFGYDTDKRTSLQNNIENLRDLGTDKFDEDFELDDTEPHQNLDDDFDDDEFDDDDFDYDDEKPHTQ
eukprot:TRINITY_DN7872_c0_g1_i1.p1 TRINITY_DN7872_c0_g1~~TRINITY_DN7872_c0_g1_i1.p1  ORF type:complete len:599 (-),score=187.11 TRINITY_DN7872_c0_g1_i1:76-1872(-)